MSCTEWNVVSQCFFRQRKELPLTSCANHRINPLLECSGKQKGYNGAKATMVHNINKASVRPTRVVQNRTSYRSTSFTNVKSSLLRVAQTAWRFPFLNAKCWTKRSQWHNTYKASVHPTRVVQDAPLHFLHQHKELPLPSCPLLRLLCQCKCLFLCFFTIGCINTFKTKLTHLWMGYTATFMNTENTCIYENKANLSTVRYHNIAIVHVNIT